MGKSDLFVDIKAMHAEVTGSFFPCTVRFPDGKRIKFIVDCGLFQEEKYDSFNKSLDCDPTEYSFAICTHTHIDHCGRFPMLVKHGFNGPIYTSNIATTLIKLALTNTLQILTQNNPDSAIFGEEDLENTFSLITPVNFYEGFNPCKGIRVTLYKNAHVLGASIVVIHIYYKGVSPIYLVFTGDYNSKNTFFATRKLPKSILDKPVTIINESTYGSTERFEIESNFDNNISNSISKGYTDIIPVFAFERAQLIMLKLKQLQDKGRLSTDIPIYLDGTLAIENTNIYSDFSHMFFKDSKDFFPKNFHFVTSQDMRLSLMSMAKQKIILTTSGMGGWGPAKLYLPYFAQKKKCLIQFPGYVSKCSLGRKLLDANIGEEVVLCDGSKFIKRAIVKQTSEFSSHAKADEIIAFDNQFSWPQTILINHGETNVQNYFANKVSEETNAKQVSRLERNLVHRIGPYGLIKKFYEI